MKIALRGARVRLWRGFKSQTPQVIIDNHLGKGLVQSTYEAIFKQNITTNNEKEN